MSDDRHPLAEVFASPLHWPSGWPRGEPQASSIFKPKTIDRAVRAVEDELARLGVDVDEDLVISSNMKPLSRKPPEDAGVAVYFVFEGEPRVLACDRWRTVELNLWAIHLHIEALRAVDRWGVGSLSQLFTGYTALPASAGGRGWWEVLGCARNATPPEIEKAYKRRAQDVHPDKPGGSSEAFVELQAAKRAALGAGS